MMNGYSACYCGNSNVSVSSGGVSYCETLLCSCHDNHRGKLTALSLYAVQNLKLVLVRYFPLQTMGSCAGCANLHRDVNCESFYLL